MRILAKPLVAMVFTMLAIFGCGREATLEETGRADEALRLATATVTKRTSPSSIAMSLGTVSTQAISVLATRDQSGTQNNWNRYRDFTPAAQGLIADFVFAAPTGLDASNASLTLQVNFMGWNRARQSWNFFLFDPSRGWVAVGDNGSAGAWSWTLLTFTAPGSLAHYVQSGVIRMRYTTTSALENSFLDYVSLAATGSTGTTSPTPTATPRPPAPTPIPTTPPGAGTLPGTGRMPAGRLWGLTLDGIDNVTGILASLTRMSRRPTTRIVFDEGMPATYYRDAISQIANASYVMGEILDSFFMKDITLAGYQARVTEYMNALQDKVDIWEVGNEINGEWLGDTASTVAKMSAAYDIAKARGLTTELTLYYNEECWAKPANEMFTWTQANVPARMKQGLDYVLVSYYEDDCNDLQPNWPVVFRRLAQMFPGSRIGFGEVGTKYANRKVSYINRYYSMELAEPHFIGGFFWWYGRQDLIPYTTTYWSAFNEMIRLH